MKALKKAEQDKRPQGNGSSGTEAGGAGLELEPLPDQQPGDGPASSQNTGFTSTRQAAANVFHAKRATSLSLVGVTSALAALFVVGFGVYVYLETRTPPAFQISPRPAQTASQPAPTTPHSPPAAPSSLLPRSAPPQRPAPTSPSETSGRDLAPMRQVFTDREQEPQAPAATPLPDQQIRVLPESTTPRVNPFLDNAYRALQAGKLAQAEDLYQHALKGEQNNVDALLGLAVIASNQGSPDTAGRYYLRVLEIDPRNVIAQAGLIALFGRSDPAAEGRLQRLIQQHPAPFLHFTLGNLHAEQGRWAPAEQDYFHAYQMEPTNPDYALNLAISLDHLGQQKPALTYYQLALSLAQDKGSARFDRDMIAMRIAQLKAASRIISDGKQ